MPGPFSPPAGGGGGGPGSDTTAIHDDTPSEVSAITEKTVPIAADLLVIEDSADSNNKKKIQIGNLPSRAPYFIEDLWVETTTASDTVTVTTGKCEDDAGASMADWTSNTLDMSTTGINALDANDTAKAASTVYNVFRLDGSSGSGIIATTSETGPVTVPVGYADQKRLVGWFRTDTFSSVVGQVMVGRWNDREVLYDRPEDSSWYVINNGTATSQTAVGTTKYVPSYCTHIFITPRPVFNSGSSRLNFSHRGLLNADGGHSFGPGDIVTAHASFTVAHQASPQGFRYRWQQRSTSTAFVYFDGGRAEI